MVISFTTNLMQVKHLSSERVGFDSTRITFNALLVGSVISILFGFAPYLTKHGAKWDLIICGFVCGNSAALGIVSMNYALTNGGPAGPVTAIAAMSSPTLLVLEAIWNWEMISVLQIVGVIFGLYGALTFTYPEFIEKHCISCGK
jgi:drug/metabolite transporter (DMT)-like permease